VSAEGGGGHAQGGGEGGEADGVAAVAGEEGLGDGEDVFALPAIPFGGEAKLAIEGVGLGAEGAWVGLHGRYVSYDDIKRQGKKSWGVAELSRE
jgi:hypothetical protein